MSKKPISVEEYCQQNNVDISMAKKVINVHEQEKSYFNYHCCNICDCELDQRDHDLRSVSDFMAVCKDHREYASMYMKDMARRIYRIRTGNHSKVDRDHIRGLRAYWNSDASKIDDPVTGIARMFGTTKENVEKILSTNE